LVGVSIVVGLGCAYAPPLPIQNRPVSRLLD
jgi:hypothetical protein